MKFNRTILLAATALIACSRIGVEEMPRPVVPEMGEDVVQGELLVRFDASVANILDKAGLTKSGPSNVLTFRGGGFEDSGGIYHREGVPC